MTSLPPAAHDTQAEPLADAPNIHAPTAAVQDFFQQMIALYQDATTTDTTADDTTTAVEAAAAALPPQECPHCRNHLATDCGNQMCGRCCLFHGYFVCGRHGNLGPLETITTMEETTTTERDDVLPECPTCQNRAAVDCGNGMCGRCCLAHGHSICSRHGAAGQQIIYDTTTTTEEDTMTSLPPAPRAISQSHCRQCGRNRAALDCDLGNCGPCCVMSGVYCPRHNM
jgi:hypothetical protein